MAPLDEYLRKSGDRLLRQPWGTDANQLAQELYSILRSVPQPVTGALQVNLGDVKFNTTEAPDFALPLIDFDALTPTGVLAPQETAIKGSDGQQTDNARVFRRRTVLLGRIESKAGTNSYTCKVYPNGPTGDYERISGVQEVQERDVADDTWVLIFRLDICRFVTTSITDGQTITQNRIDLLSRQHFFAEGNSPRAYAPWGSGATLSDSPARPHVLSLVNEIVQDGISGSQQASSTFIQVSPLLWLPDDATRTYDNLFEAFIGSVSMGMDQVTLTFDKVSGDFTMSFSGGTPSGSSSTVDAYTWATSAAVGTVTAAGAQGLSYPPNAWNTGTIYVDSGGGWYILTSEVTSQWANLGGSPVIYSRSYLVFT